MMIQHMKTDPNAIKHADLGMAGFILGMTLFFVFGDGLIDALLFGHGGSFVMGALIELMQRWQRAFKDWKFIGFAHAGQNTIKESALDVMQTGLFYITFWVRKGL